MSAVVHCASDPRKPDDDLDAAVQLLLAARAADVPHLVYVSIVGVDPVPYAYYKAKHRVEEIVEDGGVPWTILRATQFHDFVAPCSTTCRAGPVALVPRGDQRPARRRARGGVTAGGARPRRARRAASTTWAARRCSPSTSSCARTSPRPAAAARVWTVPLLGPLSGYRRGDHLTPEHATGRLTFAEWLQSRLTRPETERQFSKKQNGWPAGSSSDADVVRDGWNVGQPGAGGQRVLDGLGARSSTRMSRCSIICWWSTVAGHTGGRYASSELNDRPDPPPAVGA